ncbi:MAG TPA: VCBS repeat-containing protein [Candidatus Polarisedimenticolia bacterium]|jgi:hypothetical protein|nr:VCBS repeat-containing protein [Candidatus Polarisedimenticolia bacterium]
MVKNPLPPGLGGRRRAAELFVLLACLGMSLPSAGLIATGPLYPQTWFPTDSDARVFMGRFDADAALDLVTSASGAILVRRNDGRARFSRLLFGANVGPEVYAAAVGDFTGDGLHDVLVADSDVGLPGSLAVLPGHGDGTLGAAIGATPYTGYADFVVGDLNADAKDDLVSVNRATFDGIIIFLSRGDGNFSIAAISIGGFPSDLAVGDFNGDGTLDLSARLSNIGSTTPVVVLLNSGDGATFVQEHVAVPGQNVDVAVGDLNGDGRSDLAATISNPARLLVYLGQPDGSFAPGGGAGPEAGLVSPILPAVATLGGAGGDDVVLHDGFDLVTLLNNGDGTFRPVRRRLGLYGKKTFADLDGDGRTDMIMGAILFLGNGDGTFAQWIVSPAENCVNALAAADFDGDGRLDAASSWSCVSEPPASFRTGGVQIHIGRGDGSFDSPRPAVSLGDGDANALATGDFDGDGRPDLAVVNFLKNNLTVALNTGLASFGSPVTYTTGAGPRAVVAGDLNRDGLDDLAVADATGSTVSVLLSLGGALAAAVDYPVGEGPSALAIGDFDGDGHADLATADPGSDTVSVLAGRGDGAFVAAVSRPAPGIPRAIAAGDLDRDGRDDIAVVNGGIDELRIFLSDGDIVFRPRTLTEHFSVAIADVEADGAPDVIADGWVLPGDARGGFRPPVDYYLFGGLVVGQFDGASGLDLLSLASPGLVVLPNQMQEADKDDDGILDAIDNCPSLYNPDQADGDLDAIGDLCDNCPAGYNPAQIDRDNNGTGDVCDPELPFVTGLTVSSNTPFGKGSGTLRWSTNWEVNLLGFNAVVYDQHGQRTQMNLVLIPCEECATELGTSYTFLIPKLKGGRNIFLEAVFRDAPIVTLGPATRE